jgi:hypothetical protein
MTVSDAYHLLSAWLISAAFSYAKLPAARSEYNEVRCGLILKPDAVLEIIYVNKTAHGRSLYCLRRF